MWVAVGEGGTYTIAYSNNGITWTGVQDSSRNIFTTRGNGVAYNGTRWLAVGQGGFSMAYSSNGIIWEGVLDSSTMFSSGGYGIVWNAGKGGVFMNSYTGILYSDYSARHRLEQVEQFGAITLNEYGLGLSNKLDIVCDNYYNKGYRNFTLTIK
jgi:hypothetical protein